MKNILPLVLALFFLASCGGSPETSDLFSRDLKGKVSYCRIAYYNALEEDGDVLKAKPITAEVIEFSEDGWITSFHSYTEGGGMEYVGTFEFDDDNYPTRRIFDHEFNSDSDYEETITYDDKHHVVKVVTDGSIEKTIKYTYDDDDHLSRVESEEEGDDEDVSFTVTFKYDDGKLKKAVREGNDYDAEYYYDKEGRLSKIEYGDGTESELTYNDKGFIESVSCDCHFFDTLYWINEHRSEPWFDMYLEYLENGCSYRYSYDEQGNWIKRTKYGDDDEAVEVIERTIEYW